MIWTANHKAPNQDTDTRKGQKGRTGIGHGGPHPTEDPVQEGDHHTVGGGQKGIVPRGRVVEAQVLDQVGNASRDAQGDTGFDVSPVQVLEHRLVKDRAHKEAGENETDP